MKTITAETGQTLSDIAIQELGDIAGVFDVLELNPYLRLDMSIPAGTKVFVPDKVINASPSKNMPDFVLKSKSTKYI